ncbi:hypothetical protein ACRALDRAFT_1072529 [Sodiomyces alcalophilus JCM 7366]|uniref:uncharacterized protein n=1 Tax=Sodiomyces alcalophilus JCM 7366 TaxID=591952 RepID=UPI0039B4B1D5
MPPGFDPRNGAPFHAASPPSKRDLKSWWKGFKLPSKHQEPHGTTPSIYASSSPKYSLDPFYSQVILDLQLDTTLHPLELILGVHDAHVIASEPPLSGDATASTSKKCFHSLVGSARCWTRPQGIFGVPLRQSITYANVAISLVDENGRSYIYGYVPIVVAKCGVFLKEKATSVEGIFRLSGSEKRIKELKQIFDSPDRYGKGLVWDGYTVHDASNLLRRYLNDLPEPVVPLDLYEKFREPLKGATKPILPDSEGPQLVDNFDEDAAIAKYQQLITELPPLNRQLLLYILDLLAVFAAKSDENRMTSQNLAAIFQPGMLSHPAHAMAPEEYRLNQCVIIFLIENQDHFLIGMQGTGTDEKTKQEIEMGTPPVAGPSTPSQGRRSGLGRSASNASAGAESVRRDGTHRRNRSTSSRHSRHDGATTPNSPGLAVTPTGGLARSNTVPSKKSPNLQAGRFRGPNISPLSTAKGPALHEAISLVPTQDQPGSSESSIGASNTIPESAATSSLAPGSVGGPARSQERLLEHPQDTSTPTRERNLHSLFQRSPSGEAEKRQPNKLKKKRLPGSLNPSAHSSSTSLQGSHSAAPSPAVEAPNPLEYAMPQVPEYGPNLTVPSPADAQGENTQKASQGPPTSSTLYPDDHLRSKKSPPTSLRSSANDGSDMDVMEEPVATATAEPEKDKEKKMRWRLSRHKREDIGSSTPDVTSAPLGFVGSNDYAGMSATSIGSSINKPRKSLTGESSDASPLGGDVSHGQDGNRDRENREELKGPIGWIRHKYREAKENAEQRRTKSPPPDGERSTGLEAAILPARGKSMEMIRDEANPNPEKQPTTASAAPEAAKPTTAQFAEQAPVPEKQDEGKQ